MNTLCEKCKGACCETWAISNSDPAVAEPVHGRMAVASAVDGLLFLKCRCSHLTVEGRCGVYKTRPVLCRTFEPGGAGCLSTLKAVRPELYEEGLQHGRRHGAVA